MMAKSLASEAIVTENGRAADRARGFQTIHPSRDTLNARGWLENEWQLVQQRGAGRATCSQTPLSVTTLVVITAYTKLRLLPRTNPGSVYWRKESKWKVSRKGAEKRGPCLLRRNEMLRPLTLRLGVTKFCSPSPSTPRQRHAECF